MEHALAEAGLARFAYRCTLQPLCLTPPVTPNSIIVPVNLVTVHEAAEIAAVCDCHGQGASFRGAVTIIRFSVCLIARRDIN